MLSNRRFSFFCLAIAIAFMFSVIPAEETASAQTPDGDCPPYNPVLAKNPGWLKSLTPECLKKYEAFHRSREKTDVTGQVLSPGPDDYGYTSEAITYNWITATTPSGLTGDDRYASVNLGFMFPFYDGLSSLAYLNTNGLLTFMYSSYGYPYGAAIPDMDDPNNFIAPFWEDLVVGAPFNSGAIYYSQGGSSPNRYFVVEWRNVTYWWDTSTPFSFETILYENGNIVFQYQSVPSPDNYYWTSVGIENSDGTDGLQYHYYSNTGLSASTAIRFNFPTTPTARVKVTPTIQGAFSTISSSTTFSFTVYNIGTNGTDVYDFLPLITTPWAISLYASDGVTLLTDTNTNSYIDTGPITQGGSKMVLARITPPGGSSEGDYVSWSTTVRSSLNDSKSKVVTFQLSIPPGFFGVYRRNGYPGYMIAKPTGTDIHDSLVTGYSYNPVVDRTSSGSYLYAWDRSFNNAGKYWNNIQYSLVGSDGSVIRSPGNLTDNSGATLEIYDEYPAVAVAPNGMIGITWSRFIYNAGTDKYNTNILLAILDPSGNLAYGPLSVTNNNQWGSGNDLNFDSFSDPTIAATSDNRFTLGWVKTTHPVSNTWAYNIWGAVYTTSAGVVRVPTAYTADNNWKMSPVLNTLGNGNVILNWTLNPVAQYYLVMNSSGGIIKGTTLLDDGTTDAHWSNSDAVALPNGKVAVGWQREDGIGNTGITFVILDSGFNVIAGPTTAFAAQSMLRGNQSLSMTTNYLSQVIFTWGEDKGKALFYALGDSTGAFITPPIAYNTDLSSYAFDTSYKDQGSAPWPTDFVSSWYGGAVVTANQNVVVVGRPHIGSEVASYGGFSSGSTTMYVPMLFKQMWGSYDSALYIQNTDTANTANVSIKFYDPNGTLNCTKNDTISAQSSKGYWMPSETCLPANWYGGVVVTADRDIVAVGRPHIGNQVMTYNGFSSGSLSMYVPMLFKQQWGYDSAFYVQNTDDTNDANITIKYYDPAGTLNCETTDIIPKLSSHGYWLPSETCLPANWYGGVVVTSDTNIVAVGRPHLGSEITTYNGFSGGSLTMYAPMLFKGAYGSYDSALYVQNVDGTNTANVTLKFYNASGSLSCTKTDTILPGSSKGYWLPSESCLPAGWVGSVKVESDQPVVGIARPHLGSSITAYDGFTSGGGVSSVPMLFKQMWGSYDSAVYIENTDPSNSATVTTAFYDVNGNLSCTKTDTIGALATKSYWLPSLTCSP